MTNYYLRDGARERGPFMLDDLKYQRIKNTTEVKMDNGDWHLVQDNPDLRSLLDLKKDNAVVPTKGKNLKSTLQNNPQQTNKKLVLVLGIAMLLASLGVAVAVFFVTNN